MLELVGKSELLCCMEYKMWRSVYQAVADFKDIYLMTDFAS